MADTTTQENQEPETVSSGPEEVEDASFEDASLSADALRARWQSRRPQISHLKDAVIFPPGTADALPLFDVGDRIVVERCTDLLKGNPWLDTTIGIVRSIDDDTGLVTVLDESTDQRNPGVRYFSVRIPELQAFKLAPPRGNPFNAEKVKLQKPAPVPGEVRKGRGRPPGSKNRHKDVIKAERDARKQVRSARKAKR